ncbi:hypothetical protein [Alicyclobacillus fodiniaquatilis]|uniref:GFO/IDH/MocA-like oxidoreductase domain-containing protein n=1 Tax=Alicyclobacillus fodiniaquatilis TaxID=1661150 RepID=A0ABW4JH54_9BACL
MKIGILSYQHGPSEALIRCLKQDLGVTDVMIWQRGSDGAAHGESTVETFINEVDGVIVLGHDECRFADVLQVLQLGKPLLCEPVIDMVDKDTRSLLAEADKDEVLLIPAFPMRMSPVVGNLKDTIESGRLGEIVGVHGVSNTGVTTFWGEQVADENAFIRTTMHLVDTILWLLQSDVKSVYGATTNLLTQEKASNRVGSVQMVFDNGVIAGLASISPEAPPDTDDRNFSLSVVGTLGTCDMRAYGQRVEERTKARTTILRYGDEPMVLLISEFLRLVAGEDATSLQLPRFRDCARVGRVMQAIGRSTKTSTLVLSSIF